MLLVSIKNRSSHKKKVSVVIPAYNEDKTVGGVVEAVKALDYIDEVIVVDDGSEDETAKKAEEAGAIVIKHPKNKGKGAAMKTGFKNSKGDIIAFIDADLRNLTPKKVDKVIKPILEGKADVTKTKFKREAGRVTELTAKPLLGFFFPELKFDQPLSGQFAAKRSFLDKIKFEDDYGVDVGIVLDADVMGVKIKEVDIGKIQHTLSSLGELKTVAHEVVRTIVDRAVEYGRVTMIDSLGKYMRMGILGLSFASLGIFSIFFLRFVPPSLGIAILIIGLIIAFVYLSRLITRSAHVILRSEGKVQTMKSFIYMHFPIIVSGLILVALLTTLLGSVHVDEGKISIEPTSRNLIIWEPAQNKSFEIRGPYTVDSALENEYNILRVPEGAVETLGLNYGDSMYIKGRMYGINETRPWEDNILRIPFDARESLDLTVGDVIPDSNIRKVFKNIYAEKSLALEGNIKNNLTIKEGVFLVTDKTKGRIINIYVDDKKVTATAGILKNGYYSVYINDIQYETIKINEEDIKNTYFLYWDNYVIKIEIGDETKSDMEFAPSDEGRFLNFIFPEQ